MSAQSLKVLPQGPFGDAVNKFVAKDDKHAMELFVSEHLTGQVKQMLGLESDDEDLNNAMEIYKNRIEQQVSSGQGKAHTERKRVLQPKPDTWDSEFDGAWEEAPDAWLYEEVGKQGAANSVDSNGRSSRVQTKAQDNNNEDMSDAENDPPAAKTRGRTTKAAAAKKPPARKAPARGRGRKAAVPESDEEEEEAEKEEDVVMESDEPEPEPQPKATRGRRAAQPAKSSGKSQATGASGRASGRTKQSKLDFSQKSGGTQAKAVEISDDEISDDEDAFEPAPVASRTRKR